MSIQSTVWKRKALKGQIGEKCCITSHLRQKSPYCFSPPYGLWISCYLSHQPSFIGWEAGLYGLSTTLHFYFKSLVMTTQKCLIQQFAVKDQLQKYFGFTIPYASYCADHRESGHFKNHMALFFGIGNHIMLSHVGGWFAIGHRFQWILVELVDWCCCPSEVQRAERWHTQIQGISTVPLAPLEHGYCDSK